MATLKTYTAKFNKCKWVGSKYKIKIALSGDYCPKCESDDVVIYGKPQKIIYTKP